MENKKSYYENDGQNMQDFNPRFSDLYQEYSDSQHNNHTFNLNGTIYVHNHHGGEPIPVGKEKSPTGSKSTAKPNRSLSQRERNWRAFVGVNPSGAGTVAAQRGNTAGRVRPKVKPPVPDRTRAGGGQGAGNGRIQSPKNPANRAVRGFIVGFILLFLIAMIVPIVVEVVGLINDTDFMEEDGDIYEEPDILERENESLADPITEEGVVYIMGGYIQIGATADTLWESYDAPEFQPQDPVQPGENYYVTLDLGEKYGLASIVLKNTSDTATQEVNKLVITDVGSDYYTEWGEDFDSTRTQTDCEIIGGITIGMDYTEALWALSEVCDNPQMLNSSEGDRGHLVGYSEKYYYSITIENEEISGISVTLKDMEQ